MPSEVMTVVELAEYLKLDPQTIYRRFRRGELPGVRIGRAVRFKRDVIDGWLRMMSHRWDPDVSGLNASPKNEVSLRTTC